MNLIELVTVAGESVKYLGVSTWRTWPGAELCVLINSEGHYGTVLFLADQIMAIDLLDQGGYLVDSCAKEFVQELSEQNLTWPQPRLSESQALLIIGKRASLDPLLIDHSDG